MYAYGLPWTLARSFHQKQGVVVGGREWSGRLQGLGDDARQSERGSYKKAVKRVKVLQDQHGDRLLVQEGEWEMQMSGCNDDTKLSGVWEWSQTS